MRAWFVITAFMALALLGCNQPAELWRVSGLHAENLTRPDELIAYVARGGPGGTPLGITEAHRVARVDATTGKVLSKSETSAHMPFKTDMVFGWNEEFIVIDLGGRWAPSIRRGVDPYGRSDLSRKLPLGEPPIAQNGRRSPDAVALIAVRPVLAFAPVRSDGPLSVKLVSPELLEVRKIAVGAGADRVFCEGGVILTQQNDTIIAYDLEGGVQRWEVAVRPGEQFAPSPSWLRLRDSDRARLFLTMIHAESVITLIVRDLRSGIPVWQRELSEFVEITGGVERGGYVFITGKTHTEVIYDDGTPLDRWMLFDTSGKLLASAQSKFSSKRGAFADVVRCGFAWDKQNGGAIASSGDEAVLVLPNAEPRVIESIPGWPVYLKGTLLVCHDGRKLIGLDLTRAQTDP